MIELVQQRMAGRDFWDMRPLLLAAMRWPFARAEGCIASLRQKRALLRAPR